MPDDDGAVSIGFSCTSALSGKEYFGELKLIVEISWLSLIEQTEIGSETAVLLSTRCLDDLLQKLHLCLSDEALS